MSGTTIIYGVSGELLPALFRLLQIPATPFITSGLLCGVFLRRTVYVSKHDTIDELEKSSGSPYTPL